MLVLEFLILFVFVSVRLRFSFNLESYCLNIYIYMIFNIYDCRIVYVFDEI